MILFPVFLFAVFSFRSIRAIEVVLIQHFLCVGETVVFVGHALVRLFVIVFHSVTPLPCYSYYFRYRTG